MVSSTETSSIIGRIADFRSQHPGIYFRIYEGNTYQLMDKLNTGLIEAAIVRTPFPEDSYECSYLAEEPMMAVGMPGPVSYTHLDVYKRQGCSRCTGEKSRQCNGYLDGGQKDS